MPDAAVADTIEAMTASLVYLVLRQVLQMLAQLARDGGAKEVELLVLRQRWRCYADRCTALTCNRPTGWCWPPCRGCCPARAGRRCSSPRRPYCAGTAS